MTDVIDHTADTGSDHQSGDPSSPRRSGGSERGPARALIAMAVVAAALTALIVWVNGESQQPSIDPVEIAVAPETAADLGSGEGDDAIEAVIYLRPNQDLVLRNNDWQPHTVGDLVAARGEVVRMAFPSEGRHIVTTTLRRDRRLTILVEDVAG